MLAGLLRYWMYVGLDRVFVRRIRVAGLSCSNLRNTSRVFVLLRFSSGMKCEPRISIYSFPALSPSALAVCVPPLFSRMNAS
jgi:hypothetical protein